MLHVPGTPIQESDYVELSSLEKERLPLGWRITMRFRPAGSPWDAPIVDTIVMAADAFAAISQAVKQLSL